MQVNYKKSLGQNFIYDTNFLESIIKDLKLSKDDLVIEVGTGLGTLTNVIAKHAGHVITYEVDKSLTPILNHNVELIYSDALTAQMPNQPYKLVANIPYYITTPLLTKFTRDPNCTQINVLVQLELANRIVAKPSTPEYGALTIGIQSWGTPRILRNAPRQLFKPVPKVDSAFLTIAPHKNPIHICDKFLKQIFSQRRKTILNALSRITDKSTAIKILTQLNIHPAARPETLTIPQFQQVFHQIKIENLVGIDNQPEKCYHIK